MSASAGTVKRRRNTILAAMTLANAMILVDQTAVPLALPDIMRTFGTALLSVVLAGLVFGLSQSQPWGWDSPGVILPLVLAVISAVMFVWHERRTAVPLMDFALLRKRNYLGASISQLLAGMAEIGLGVIFPLLLILNLEMDPGLAGLALIPTTLPMILIAPLAGRWYDSAGGRPPLVTGFLLLAASGVLLAIGVQADGDLDNSSYAAVLPGLMLYGIGLSLVLTVNDPVTLDTIAERDHGQASGVSATAEQFGGALGIAVLYSIFHSAYVGDLHRVIDASPLPALDDTSGPALRDALQHAEATGLHVSAFDPELQRYIDLAGEAAIHGYSITFVAVAVLALLGAAATAWLVRKPPVAAATAGPDGGTEPVADTA